MNTKVTPKPKFKLQGVKFETLSAGDCFLWDSSLMMRLPVVITDGQAAVNLSDGQAYDDLCGSYVRPVDVEIKWKRQ